MGQIYSLLETSTQQYNDVTCVEHSYKCFREKKATDVEVDGLTVLEVEHSGLRKQQRLMVSVVDDTS